MIANGHLISRLSAVAKSLIIEATIAKILYPHGITSGTEFKSPIFIRFSWDDKSI